MATSPRELAAAQPAGSVLFSTDSFVSEAGPSSRAFAAGGRIFWQARFARPANGVRLDVVTVRLHASGWEELVSGHTMWLTHPALPGYSGWIGPGAYEGPGTYALRLVRADTILAEGTFELVDEAPSSPVH
jgi:hypothetical protein